MYSKTEVRKNADWCRQCAANAKDPEMKVFWFELAGNFDDIFDAHQTHSTECTLMNGDIKLRD
jgi:hypothetical protein